jgi:hypothetical protein
MYVGMHLAIFICNLVAIVGVCACLGRTSVEIYFLTFYKTVIRIKATLSLHTYTDSFH